MLARAAADVLDVVARHDAAGVHLHEHLGDVGAAMGGVGGKGEEVGLEGLALAAAVRRDGARAVRGRVVVGAAAPDDAEAPEAVGRARPRDL